MSKNIFSESRGIVDDGFQNATDIEEAREGVHEDVREGYVASGVKVLSDCPYCGIQWMGIVKWPEVMGFFLGQVVPNTQSTPRGVGLSFGCRKCNRASPLLITWDDVERYVAKGVKTGALPQDIYRAREQILAERRAKAGQARR